MYTSPTLPDATRSTSFRASLKTRAFREPKKIVDGTLAEDIRLSYKLELVRTRPSFADLRSNI